MSVFTPETALPRKGFEQRWADLANKLALTSEQKSVLETFMSDLQDAAHTDGQHSMLPQ